MAKWISKGPGKVEPANEAAKVAQALKDKQNGKINSAQLKEVLEAEKARVENSAIQERVKLGAETKARDKAYADKYVPPAFRPGANVKFRERNARLAKNG